MAVIKKKTWPEYFEAIISGKKKFDFRVNDFEIAEGDTLVLQEYDPVAKQYTGREVEKKVTYVAKFTLDSFGQKKEIEEKGMQVISLE
jgi:hypothetical protein